MRRPITYIDVKLVRPLGLDNSAAAAAAQTEFKCKISKKNRQEFYNQNSQNLFHSFWRIDRYGPCVPIFVTTDDIQTSRQLANHLGLHYKPRSSRAETQFTQRQNRTKQRIS